MRKTYTLSQSEKHSNSCRKLVKFASTTVVAFSRYKKQLHISKCRLSSSWTNALCSEH